MGLYDYMILEDTEQWNVLWNKGDYITHRLDDKYKCNLYALFDFFVEVRLDPITDKILDKAHFKTGIILDKYAGDIDIN
ncbi:hypothetical protein [Maribacter sp. 2210JD10-5]|uniref:hypothetical protein n=1 Tax=Maribacter sp. 2210JD10-5 TaxID=3386272 RepID=UPI0039BD0D43